MLLYLSHSLSLSCSFSFFLSFSFALCRLSLTGSSAERTQARTTSNAQATSSPRRQHHRLCAINISHNNAKCQSDWQKEQRFSAFPERCPSSSPSSNSSQLPVTILTNAYSLSDSPIPAPLTTLHSSHFRCCCCCLLSPVCSHIPLQLFSYLFFLLHFPLSRGSVVCLATQPHQHGHTRGPTARGGSNLLPSSCLPGVGTQAQEVPK